MRPLLLFGATIGALLTLPCLVTAEPMSIEHCLREAVRHHPSLRMAHAAIRSREAEADSTRGHLLPVLKTRFNLTRWDSDQDLRVDVSSFAALLKDFEPLLSAETKTAIATLSADGLSLPVRDDLTWQTGVTVGQPLTKLYPIAAGYSAQKDLAAAARLDATSARRLVEADTARAWYGLAAATRLRSTAEAALRQIEAVETQVAALLDAGMVEPNALLKVRVQKADIERRLFQADKAASLTTAFLNAQMGRELTLPIEPEGDGRIATETDEGPGHAGEAVLARPELQAARLRVAAARRGRHVALGEALPQLTAFFTYENNQGFGQLVKENQFYGGLALEWNVWDWGASWYKVRAARARAAEAEAALALGEDRVRLDLASRRLDLEEAHKARALSQRQLEQAHENLRVEQLRFDVRETTVTDLLTATTLSLQAANEDVVAEMKVQEARLALRLAQGDDLLKETGEER